MPKAKRSYHCPEVMDIHTMRDCLYYAKHTYADRLAYRQPEGNGVETAISFRGLADQVDALGTRLLSLGLQGMHIALLGETSIEWITAYLAIVDGVGVALPIDKELTVDTMAAQLRFGDAQALFISAGQLKRLKDILAACPGIKTVILMREKQSRLPLEPQWLLMSRLVEEGRCAVRMGDVSYVQAALDPHAMMQIIFTSGTTGANKGVMISHENVWTCGQGARQLVCYLGTNISLLPVNHTYELTCNLASSLFEGATVCLNDDLKHVMQNIRHFRPEMTCMVPMMVDMLARKIKNGIEEKGMGRRVATLIRLSNALRRLGIDRRRVFFKPLLENLGGNLTKIICGGAPLSEETVRFLDDIGITVLVGYGITECAPLVAVNGDRCRRLGSVGQVLPTCEVRIDRPDADGNGEVLVRGGNVMLGYYKAPEDTAAVFTEDGWFKTGDIGHFDKEKYLYLCGRTKNLIILANGKNVFPEEVEDHLKKAVPYVEEAVVFADEGNTGIYAVCYLQPTYCREHGLMTEQQQYAHLMEDVQRYNRGAETFKRIHDVRIRAVPFEKTTTQKIKRFTVEKA